MDLREPLSHYHEEHREILEFLRRWEQALELAASGDKKERCRGLAELREMEPRIAAISEHCEEEERNADSAFRLYLDDAVFEQLRAEHDVLEEFSDAYLEELRYVTAPPPAGRLVSLGRRLVAQLREHVAFEENLLKKIEESSEAEEKVFLRYTQAAE
jgi:hypothetical protein